jgi:putative spermidine/putrescine transport system substrate-binding protein
MRCRPFALLFLSVIAMAMAMAMAACKPSRESATAATPPVTASSSWDSIERVARGQTVHLMMWQGDPYINAYMRDYVVPEVRKRYGVNLEIGSGQGSQIVTALMTEIEARKKTSSFDLAWINGETFYQLRQVQALYGPFVERLPNRIYLNMEDRFIRYDFQQEVNGYECPWGNVQFALIYNSANVPEPPRTRAQLAAWVKQHPGRFTIDTSFSGMTFLKCLLIDVAGGEKELAGPFDEAKYAKYSGQLWDYLNGIKPYFWKRGETFPTELSQLHQMFANGEVDFTMSNNDGEVDNKVAQGLFPATSRAYVLDSGTIQNTHYMGITRNAPSLAGALVVVNFLISPMAQLEKMKPSVWGDTTVLDIRRLQPQMQTPFLALAKRKYGPERAEIQSKALMELAPTYMTKLYDDFRTHVVER